MKPVDFSYVRPATVSDAVRLLSDNPDAKVLAGGQTLGPMLNLRLAQPSMLVDITRIPELTRIEDTAEHLTLGACITHASIEDGRVPDAGNGTLNRIARRIAYRAVRVRGTIGGSIAHADPAADWLALLTALDAALLVQGPAGQRITPVGGFVTGPMLTTLAADEIISGIRIPKLGRRSRVGYSKICRKTGDFADAIGVAVFEPAQGTLRLVAGAVTGAPIVIDDVAYSALADVAARTDYTERLRMRLRASGYRTDAYDLHIHAAVLLRAIDEVSAV